MKVWQPRRFPTQEAAEAAITQQKIQFNNHISYITHLPPYIFPSDPNRFLVSNFIEERAA